MFATQGLSGETHRTKLAFMCEMHMVDCKIEHDAIVPDYLLTGRMNEAGCGVNEGVGEPYARHCLLMRFVLIQHIGWYDSHKESVGRQPTGCQSR